jgi:uncharacterized tellurite resistance protein B-like protein
MTRWSDTIDRMISLSADPIQDQYLEAFFQPRNYLPQTKEEEQVFEEFSLVTSSMAILIQIAKADKKISSKEKDRIIEDLIFQLEQRPYEYNRLSQKFGISEREIIQNIFDQIMNDYNNNELDLDQIIDVISMIYQNNPEKRYYLIRLCFYCAFSDENLSVEEKKAIREIAAKLKVPPAEIDRIEVEVIQELKIKADK